MWYHSIRDKSWKKSSYTKFFYTFKTLIDYSLFTDLHSNQSLTKWDVLFLMRKASFPIGKIPITVMGCCLSFKIPGSTVKEEFCKILLHCITEDILQDPEQFEELNGFSIAPKKEFNIAKIWMRNKQGNYTDLLKEVKPCLLDKDCMIKDVI